MRRVHAAKYAKVIQTALTSKIIKQMVDIIEEEVAWGDDDMHVGLADLLQNDHDLELEEVGRDTFVWDYVEFDMPTWEDVVLEAASKEFDDPAFEDAINSFYTERMHVDVWNDNIQFELENSGPGYWLRHPMKLLESGHHYKAGVVWEYDGKDWAEIDKPALTKAIAKLTKDNNVLKVISTRLDKGPTPKISYTGEEIADMFIEWMGIPDGYGSNNFDYAPFIKLSSHGLKVIKQIEDDIAGLGKSMSDIEGMADNIVANKWWDEYEVARIRGEQEEEEVREMMDMSLSNVVSTLDSVSNFLDRADPALAMEIDNVANSLKETTADSSGDLAKELAGLLKKKESKDQFEHTDLEDRKKVVQLYGSFFAWVTHKAYNDPKYADLKDWKDARFATVIKKALKIGAPELLPVFNKHKIDKKAWASVVRAAGDAFKRFAKLAKKHGAYKVKDWGNAGKDRGMASWPTDDIPTAFFKEARIAGLMIDGPDQFHQVSLLK